MLEIDFLLNPIFRSRQLEKKIKYQKFRKPIGKKRHRLICLIMVPEFRWKFQASWKPLRMIPVDPKRLVSISQPFQLEDQCLYLSIGCAPIAHASHLSISSCIIARLHAYCMPWLDVSVLKLAILCLVSSTM